jgi:hypothetical protein
MRHCPKSEQDGHSRRNYLNFVPDFSGNMHFLPPSFTSHHRSPTSAEISSRQKAGSTGHWD